MLNHKQGQVLLELARKSLEHKLQKGKNLKAPQDPALLEKAATFNPNFNLAAVALAQLENDQ